MVSAVKRVLFDLSDEKSLKEHDGKKFSNEILTVNYIL